MNLQKIIFILGKTYKKKAIVLLLISLPIAFLEMLGIGMMIPLFSLFVDNNYFSKFNISNVKYFDDKLIIIIFLISIIILYFLKFIFSFYLIYQRNKFNYKLYVDLTQKIYKSYLNRPYSFHIENNSAKLIRNVKDETSLFVFQVISPAIEIIIELCIFITIGVFLFYYNPMVSLSLILFFFCISYCWYKLYNKRFQEYGNVRQKQFGHIIKHLQESFGNLKEIIIFSLEDIFFKKYLHHNERVADVGIKKDTLINLPRFFFELTGIAMLICVMIYFIAKGTTLDQLLISLGVFVFASVRLLPSFTKIVRGLQTVKYNKVVIDAVYEEIEYYSKNFLLEKVVLEKVAAKKLTFNKIKINDASFIYPNSLKATLKNVNFELVKGDRVGVVGSTGSGKTTLINLICGLIKPTGGKILINDDVDLDKHQSSWQQNISYVPQNVHILDESILYNITFKNKLNDEEFKNFTNVLQIVKIDNFVNELPETHNTIAGEKGVKFSGGQCQRLGIARALYRESSLLILDEATNALDEETERVILKSICEKMKDRTILSISHKKSVIDFNSVILDVQDGSVKKIIN